jgi:hypothetical protein
MISSFVAAFGAGHVELPGIVRIGRAAGCRSRPNDERRRIEPNDSVSDAYGYSSQTGRCRAGQRRGESDESEAECGTRTVAGTQHELSSERGRDRGEKSTRGKRPAVYRVVIHAAAARQNRKPNDTTRMCCSLAGSLQGGAI